MERGRREACFERWRTHGDLDALREVIDGAAPELYDLAARLAPDVAQAEDLVQATFLAMLEKPHAWDGERPLVPWLVGILVNQARKSARGGRRSIEAARLAERRIEEPHERALSAELRDAVTAALATLPDASRDVVARCVLAGERPVDVAHALKREPGTVRMQLLRGLELLRRALPAGLAGSGALVLAGGRGDAAVRAAVLARAQELGPLGLASASGASTIGGVLMATKLAWSALALVLALVVWLAWPRAGERSTAEVARAVEAPSDFAHAGRDARVLPATPVSASPEAERTSLRAAPSLAAASAAPARAGWWLVGTVHGVDTADVADARLFVNSPRLGNHAVELAPDATFELDIGALSAAPTAESSALALPPPQLPPDEISLFFQHQDYSPCRERVASDSLPRERKEGERVELRRDLAVARAAIVRGSVRFEPADDGAEVRVALIERAGNTEFFGDVMLETGTDDSGRFRIRAPRADRFVVQAYADGWLAAAVEVTVETGRELALPPLVLERGAVEIEGRVDIPASLLDESSNVVGTLRQRAAPEAPRARVGYGDAGALREIRGGAPIAAQTARIAADGSFRMTGIDAGRWELEIGGLRIQALLPHAHGALVDAPSTGVVVGRDLGVIRARIERNGKPVPGAGTSWMVVSEQETSIVSPFADESGVVTVVADLHRDVTVSAHQDDVAGESLEIPAAGRPRELEIALALPPAAAGAEVVLVPAALAGAPAQLELELVTRASGDAPTLTRSLDAPLREGRYRFGPIPSGSGRATVQPSGTNGPRSFFGSFVRSESFDVVLRDGEKLEHSVALQHGGRLRVRPRGAVGAQTYALWKLSDATGRPVEGVFVSREESENRSVFRPSGAALSLQHESAFEECLLPGRYRLELESDEWKLDPLDFEVRADETTSVELAVRAR